MKSKRWVRAGLAIAAITTLAACGGSSEDPGGGDPRGLEASSLTDSDMLSECGVVGWMGAGGELVLYPVQKIGVESDFPERFAPSIPLAEDSVSQFCLKTISNERVSLGAAALTVSSSDDAVVADRGFSDNRVEVSANGVGLATLTVTANGITDVWVGSPS